jgi:hypothetical protein
MKDPRDVAFLSLNSQSTHFDEPENEIMQGNSFSSELEINKFSELELHSIKTAFVALDMLWRDVSMGSDHVQASTLSLIHKELGEIGSEVFCRIFLKKLIPSQVTH